MLAESSIVLAFAVMTTLQLRCYNRQNAAERSSVFRAALLVMTLQTEVPGEAAETLKYSWWQENAYAVSVRIDREASPPRRTSVPAHWGAAEPPVGLQSRACAAANAAF